MSAIGKGDWVECVDASAPGMGAERFAWPLVSGAVYCVERLGVVPSRFINAGQPIVVLQDVPHPTVRDGGFNPDRFRPIYRPKAELIQSLLAPAPSVPTRTPVNASHKSREAI